MELGINLKVNGTYGPVVTVSERGSEASGFRLRGFRGLFGGAVFAEASIVVARRLIVVRS